MMFTNRFRVLFTLAVVVAGVSAQSFDACGEACINSTLAAGICKSLNDTSCVCSSTAFQTTFATCLQNCSSQDLTVAQALENTTCSNVSNSTSNSTTSASSSATKAGTSSSATSSTKSNSATAVEQLPLLSAAIVIAGALMGGAFVL